LKIGASVIQSWQTQRDRLSASGLPLLLSIFPMTA